MRNTLFATAAAFALILGTAPTFAAETAKEGNSGTPQAQAQPAQQNNDGGAAEKCAEMLANAAQHTAAELAQCKNK